MADDRKIRKKVPSLDEEEPAAKRPEASERRNEEASGLSKAVSFDFLGNARGNLSIEARTAFDIKSAIEVAPTVLPMIGTCPFVVQDLVTDNCYVEEKEILEWAMKVAKKGTGPLVHFDAENFTLLDTVQQAIDDLQSQYIHVYTNEVTEKSWGNKIKSPEDRLAPSSEFGSEDCTVTIALPSLQTALGRDIHEKSTFVLGDFLLPLSNFVEGTKASEHLNNASKEASTSTQPMSGETVKGGLDYSKSLLDALFALGVTSPFGQVSTLQTVIDESVHKAKQINEENFTVSDAFIAKVEALWAERFYPSKVRAVPYKIKLYRPDGIFRSHKDTPETGLVGTFLVGLTSPSLSDVHLNVSSHNWRSSNGSYCAFYPDTPHHVLAISNPRLKNTPLPTRGTIAFKIFVRPGSQPELEIPDESALALNSAIRPFGILLKHNYTTECHGGLLKGADAALYQALCLLEKVKVQVLPVLTEIHLVFDVGEYMDQNNIECEVKVYPFTEPMIQACLASPDEAASIPPQWPSHLLKIPFLTSRSWDNCTWSSSKDPGAEHTGNESRPAEQHSIYISAALIILSE